MKCIKIDIKQEVLDLEPMPYYLFHKLEKDYPTRIIDDPSIFMGADILIPLHTEVYYMIEFFNPNAKEKRIYYLIKHDDRGLVDDLMKIEQDVLRQKRYEETLQIDSQVRLSIKRLSWWRRLFNKF